LIRFHVYEIEICGYAARHGGLWDKTRYEALNVEAKVAKLLDLSDAPADEQGISQRFRSHLLP
jgi:hypothetical protein